MAFAHNNLGSAYRKDGQHEKAVKAYNSAVMNDKEYSIAINNRGMARFDSGDFEGAVKDFSKQLN